MGHRDLFPTERSNDLCVSRGGTRGAPPLEEKKKGERNINNTWASPHTRKKSFSFVSRLNSVRLSGLSLSLRLSVARSLFTWNAANRKRDCMKKDKQVEGIFISKRIMYVDKRRKQYRPYRPCVCVCSSCGAGCLPVVDYYRSTEGSAINKSFPRQPIQRG